MLPGRDEGAGELLRWNAKRRGFAPAFSMAR
jgi:hypothetical protein